MKSGSLRVEMCCPLALHLLKEKDNFNIAMNLMSWRTLQSTSNFFNFKELQNVAFLDVVVVLDVQAAFESFFNFFCIVLEALE